MSGFLVDTNVFSELVRATPDPKVMAWGERQPRWDLFLSVISIGELRKGITTMPPGARRTRLEKSLEEQIPQWFERRILPVTQAVAERWGVLEGQRQQIGRPINVPDAQIAATAIEHDLILVTRNVRDFEHLRLTIVNPWELT